MKQNNLMSEKHKNKKEYQASNYFQHFLIFIPAFSGCVSISALASLVGIHIDITSSAVGLKIVQ